ncbi:MAG: PEP-CTERM sorting domain-containing protein [Planctomycetota bacterium]
MKNSVLLLVAVVLMITGAVEAYVIDDMEAPSTAWTVYTGGGLSTLENSTEAPYVGSRSLKMVDSVYPYVQLTTNHGDQSALKDSYVELAFKFDNPACGWLGSNGVQIYFGNDSSNRACWMVKESVIQGMAQNNPPADGWYIFHLELDNGLPTLAGTTLNGVQVPESEAAAWQSGTVDWTQIDFMAVLVFQASYSDVMTQYMDHVTLGEAIPEPTTIALLGMGGLVSFVSRRRR